MADKYVEDDSSDQYKDDGKLKKCCALFEQAVDHHAKAHEEAHRGARFYHNTNCEGQWEQGDLDVLRQNERLALTFNVLKTKIDTFLGMYADSERLPVVSASGQDRLAAEILDAIKTQLLEDANYESLAMRQIKTGTIEGECDMHIEFVPSEDGPNWVKVVLWRLMPYEVLWDPASVEPDRSDARRCWWFRWLDEDEFKRAYPDFADEWTSLSTKNLDDPLSSTAWKSELSVSDTRTYNTYSSDYQRDRAGQFYFDYKQNKIRVIRYEYKIYEEKSYAVDGDTGDKLEITSPDIRKRMKNAIALGVNIEIVDSMVEVTKVCEFIGSTILAEFDEAGPFNGFSIIPYCYEVDEETGTAYGLPRNLFDPQMELNKSRSLDLELSAQATLPGTTAEEDAIPDKRLYERERRRPNGIAIVANGALSTDGRRVIEREATPPNAMNAQRTQAAMELMNEVSGIPSNAVLMPAEQQQAGVTVAIRWHKSRQTVSSPFSHFEIAQRKLIEKLVQGVVNTMPDDQMLEIIGKREDLVIQDRRIVEMEPSKQPDPTGAIQMVPKAEVDISDMRKLRWKLDMEHTTENSTLRMMELNILLQVAQLGGAPVDPNVLVEMASTSRSTRERLKAYINEAKQATAQRAEQEAKANQASTQGILQVEAAKVQETKRHNMEQERLKAIEQEITAQLKQTEIWERADNNEKERILEIVRMNFESKQKAGESVNA